jgi:hypothetical protein
VVYVILDTKGAGRIVGVFDDLERAERIRNIDRGYYRMVAVQPNAVNPVAVEWLQTPDQREALKSA